MAKKRKRRGLGGSCGLGMSKKDYTAFADVLCKHKADLALTDDIGAIFKADNPAFEIKRFRMHIARCFIKGRG